MIDKKYQGKGYGKIALTQVIDYVKSFKVFTEIKTSYVPADNSAEGFYKNFGFIKSKKIIKELSDYLDEINLTELEYTEKDTKIKVSKNLVSINTQNSPDTNIINSNSENSKIQSNKKPNKEKQKLTK